VVQPHDVQARLSVVDTVPITFSQVLSPLNEKSGLHRPLLHDTERCNRVGAEHSLSR